MEDTPKFKILTHVKLEKFNGEMVDGQEPVEVLEFDGELDDPRLVAIMKGEHNGNH